MVFKIELENLFYGFIRNYWTFGIKRTPKASTRSKWTNMILCFFARLGQDLGFIIEYEWNRFDLTWFDSMEEREAGEPYLHVEHENSSQRLGELMNKVKTSPASNVVAIGYPEFPLAYNEFVDEIESLQKKLKSGKEVMFILDPPYYGYENSQDIIGYITRAGRRTLDYCTGTRCEAPDGTFYATHENLIEDDKEEEV